MRKEIYPPILLKKLSFLLNKIKIPNPKKIINGISLVILTALSKNLTTPPRANKITNSTKNLTKEFFISKI